jgi:hypothetical protein
LFDLGLPDGVIRSTPHWAYNPKVCMMRIGVHERQLGLQDSNPAL